jgi:hypothetical protein
MATGEVAMTYARAAVAETLGLSARGPCTACTAGTRSLASMVVGTLGRKYFSVDESGGAEQPPR